MSLKRLLTALGAAGGILLGLQTVGVKPIAPGLDTGFRKSRSCADQPGLCLETDAGDLTVLVWLWVRSAGGSTNAWHAQLSDGTQLNVTPVEIERALWHLKIEREDSVAGTSKFTWPNGVALHVANGNWRMRLERWRVFPEKGSYDSEARERWRTTWSGGMLVFIVVGVMAAATGIKSRHPEDQDMRVLIAHLVRKTISEVHGDSEKETAEIQTLLRRVLLGSVPAEVALSQMNGGSPRGRLLWFKARHRFLHHFDKLLDLLNEYRHELNELSAQNARAAHRA